VRKSRFLSLTISYPARSFLYTDSSFGLYQCGDIYAMRIDSSDKQSEKNVYRKSYTSETLFPPVTPPCCHSLHNQMPNSDEPSNKLS
jgi:hypothetical protein